MSWQTINSSTKTSQDQDLVVAQRCLQGRQLLPTFWGSVKIPAYCLSDVELARGNVALCADIRVGHHEQQPMPGHLPADHLYAPPGMGVQQ